MALLGGIIFARSIPGILFNRIFVMPPRCFRKKAPEKADRNFIYNLAESIRKNVFIDGWYLNASPAW